MEKSARKTPVPSNRLVVLGEPKTTSTTSAPRAATPKRRVPDSAGKLEVLNPEAEHVAKAPVELVAECLSSLLKGDYIQARVLCAKVLEFEPNNPTIKEFMPLLQERIELDTTADQEEDQEGEEGESEEDESEEDDEGDSEDSEGEDGEEEEEEDDNEEDTSEESEEEEVEEDEEAEDEERNRDSAQQEATSSKTASKGKEAEFQSTMAKLVALNISGQPRTVSR
eukprot:Colp12_sorted_trinity150504_noHs@17222